MWSGSSASDAEGGEGLASRYSRGYDSDTATALDLARMAVSVALRELEPSLQGPVGHRRRRLASLEALAAEPLAQIADAARHDPDRHLRDEAADILRRLAGA